MVAYTQGLLSHLRLLPVCLSLALAGCFGAEQTALSGPQMPDSMQAQSEEAHLEPSAALVGTYGPRALYKGKDVSSIKATNIDSGIVLPDGSGGVVWVPGVSREPQNADYVDARELKLKIREMAEQLIAGCSRDGAVALPVSFVNLDNLEQTSSFGRLVAEQLFYEFNQRGFPVREYRIPGNISVRDGEGEFYLSRAIGNIAATSPNSVVVAGTYSGDRHAVFVNARLIRPRDGRVLRTANLILQPNQLTKRLLAKGSVRKMEEGVMHIRDLREVDTPVEATPFDQGQDIH